MIKTDEQCRACRGRGSNYGQFCPDCNGTGIKGDPRKGCIIAGLTVVLTIAPFAYYFWPW